MFVGMHRHKLQQDEVRIQVTEIDPPESNHPTHGDPIEKGSFTYIPSDKLFR